MFMHLQSPPETASGPASVVSSRRRRPSCLRPVVVALAVALGWGTALAQEGPDRADGQVAGDASQLGTVHVREQAASAAFRAGEAEFGPLGRRPVQALLPVPRRGQQGPRPPRVVQRLLHRVCRSTAVLLPGEAPVVLRGPQVVRRQPVHREPWGPSRAPTARPPRTARA